MTEEEVAPAEMAVPEQQGPPDPPRKRLWQNLTNKVEGFTAPYEQFEQEINDPEKRARLYRNLSPGGKLHAKFEGFNLSSEEFDANLDEPTPNPSPEGEGAVVVAKKKEATGPPVGVDSPPAASASPAGAEGHAVDWDYLNKLPAGPDAQLYTENGSAPVRLNASGRGAEEVINLPKPEKNTERVRLPDDLPPEAEPPGTYQLKASTDPNARYFDRPLSKRAEGEDTDQDKWEAARRTFVNGLKEMGQGIPEYLGAAARRINDLTGGSPAAGLYAGTGMDSYADKIEASKQKVAPFYEKGEVDLHDPGTWAVPAARNAALAVPLLLTAAVPESKIAGVLQSIGAVGFDSQIVHGSFARAKAAGLTPGSKQYDTYALADATASIVVFKGLGKVLEAPAQKVLQRALVTNTLERVAQGEAFDAAFAAASKSASQLVRQSATGAATMATIGAANSVKTQAGEVAFNAATGTQTFADKTLEERLGEVGAEAGSLALIGGAGGIAAHFGQRVAGTPAFDVVRPTGQPEYQDVRVVGAPDANNEVRIVGVDAQGQPVDTKVKADYLKPRDNAHRNPAGEQAGDPAREAGHPESATPAEAQGEIPAQEPAAPGEARGSDSESRESGADPRGSGEPTGGVRPVAHAEVAHLLPDLPAEAEVLSSDDNHVAAAILPTGEVRLRASEEATPGSGAQVLDAALARGVQSLSVDSPALASYLEEMGWTVAERGEQGIRLMAPVEEAEQTDTNVPQSSPQNAAPIERQSVHAYSQSGKRPALARLDDGVAPKSLREVFLDLRKSIGGVTYFAKRPAGKQRGSGAIPGQYDANAKTIAVKPGAITTTAHELGHRLDDNFGLLASAPAAAQGELMELARHGSQAPAGMSPAQASNYARGEGLAEFVRGYLLDPAHMKAEYPELTAHYEKEVPEAARGQVTEFSNDLRRAFSQPGAANLEMEGPVEPTLKEKLLGKAPVGGIARTPWQRVTDKLQTLFTDDRHQVGVLYDYLLQAAGQTRPKGADDAMQQIARLAGFQDRLADQVKNGLTPLVESFTVNPDGTVAAVRLLDNGPGGTGEALTLDWLHAPFAGGTSADVRERIRETGDLMIAQRTLEELNNRIADRIEDELDAGGHVDPALLAKYPDIAQRQIEVTDRATKAAPRQKRTITFEQASQENMAKRQAHVGRVSAARQKRADAVDSSINNQVSRWKDYGKRAYKAWKQAKTVSESAAIIDELIGKVEAEEAAAGFSAQGKRVAGKVSTLLKKAAVELAKAKAEGREAKAEAILDRVNTKIDERIKGLEKLRKERQKAVGVKYDGKIAELTTRAKVAAVSEKAEGSLTGIGADLWADEDRADQILAAHQARWNSDGKTENARAYALEEGARRYRAWADANLQKAVEAGLLSQGEYDQIKKTKTQYVALTRIMEAAPGEDISSFTAVQRKGIGGGKKVTYRFKGSARSIKNPWASLLDGTARTVEMADRNNALRALRDVAKAAMQAGGDVSEAAREVTGQEVKGDKVKIMVDGQAEEWVFDAEAQRALLEMGRVAPPEGIAKLATNLAAFTRSAITLNPAFIARNFFRDLGEGMVVSTSGQHKGLEVLWNSAAQDMSSEILHLMGGGQGGNFVRTEADYHKVLDQAITKISQDKKTVVVKLSEAPGKAWERYKALAEKGESFGRQREVLAAFKKAKAEGMSDRDAAATAAFAARDLMDFAVAGRITRKINQFVPFTNARVQGVRRLYRTAKQDPKGFAVRFAAYALAPALAELSLIAMANRKDDYDQLPAYRKQGFYNVPLPGGGWLTVAKPFEIGAGATVVTAMLDEYLGGSDRATEGQFKHFAQSFLPINGDALTGGPAKAVAEVMNNRDTFRDKAIIPKGEEKLDLQYRHTERGSRLGQLIGEVTQSDSRNVDHLIEGIGGSTGKLATATSDIGRGDEGKGPGLGLTGAYADDAVAHGRDVEWLMDHFARHGLSGAPAIKRLQAKLDAYYAADDDELRQELGAQVRELAKQLREDFATDEDVERARFEKDNPGEDFDDQ